MADDRKQTMLLDMAAVLRRCLADLDCACIGQIAACHIDLAANLLEREARREAGPPHVICAWYLPKTE